MNFEIEIQLHLLDVPKISKVLQNLLKIKKCTPNCMVLGKLGKMNL
jgi:hypothetical protein